jgi:hypothetical protein
VLPFNKGAAIALQFGRAVATRQVAHVNFTSLAVGPTASSKRVSPPTSRKVSCWPAKLAVGKSSASDVVGLCAGEACSH